MFYSVIGDTTARKYFYVDPVTGAISLKRSIKEDTNTRYSVSTGRLSCDGNGWTFNLLSCETVQLLKDISLNG